MFSAKGIKEDADNVLRFCFPDARSGKVLRRIEMRNVKLFASALVLLLAGYAYAADKMPEGVQARKADSGTMVLADAKGMTLYTFGKDADGKSMCTAKCAM